MMRDSSDQSETVSLQDVDLLNRLSNYFDSIGHQLRQGHGWFIFNADGKRGLRLGSFLTTRVQELSPWFTYYVVPWREFSLNAYMVEVELQSLADDHSPENKPGDQYDLARRISRDSMARLVGSDLLVLTGLRPSHRHELRLLDQAIERRYNQRLATILVSPRLPHELSSEFETVSPEFPFWDRLFNRMYERSMIAL